MQEIKRDQQQLHMLSRRAACWSYINDKMKQISMSLMFARKLLTATRCSSFSGKSASGNSFSGRNIKTPITVSFGSIVNTSRNDKMTKIWPCLTVYVRHLHGCQRVGFHYSASSSHKTMKSCIAAGNLTSRGMMPQLSNTSDYSTTVSQSSALPDVSKSISALQVKRPARKKTPPVSEEGRALQMDNVVAYAVAEEINLSGLEAHIAKQGLYSVGRLPADVTTALHVRGKYNVEQRPKEIFVFEDGSVIFWCVPEIERGTFLKMLGKFSQGSYTPSLVLYEREEMDFTYARGNTSLSGDLIQLKDGAGDSQHTLLEMYAFSNALAQSVKLAMWEASFNKFVESIENVTEDLRLGRKISMSREQVLKKTGELFSLRNRINLSSDLLDTPDFYWDREALEPLYVSLCNYLSIPRRTKVMNQKLNHCCDLTELLITQLNNTHHVRLEVMIIILILVEVMFEIIHVMERYWTQPAAEPAVSADTSKETREILVH
ncbi:unnamed protein product [Candidula unifasciata]|uniref:DUF155 domain-containing protein n=1 Tax=Candidula unifasciata TaxID=100452 RepID=A0A8S3ZKJ4_9EUPU|nr:unnamed protein product [Candidula unifasciata]